MQLKHINRQIYIAPAYSHSYTHVHAYTWLCVYRKHDLMAPETAPYRCMHILTYLLYVYSKFRGTQKS